MIKEICPINFIFVSIRSFVYCSNCYVFVCSLSMYFENFSHSSSKSLFLSSNKVSYPSISSFILRVSAFLNPIPIEWSKISLPWETKLQKLSFFESFKYLFRPLYSTIGIKSAEEALDLFVKSNSRELGWWDSKAGLLYLSMLRISELLSSNKSSFLSFSPFLIAGTNTVFFFYTGFLILISGMYSLLLVLSLI